MPFIEIIATPSDVPRSFSPSILPAAVFSWKCDRNFVALT
jgi:hypothetical protein